MLKAYGLACAEFEAAYFGQQLLWKCSHLTEGARPTPTPLPAFLEESFYTFHRLRPVGPQGMDANASLNKHTVCLSLLSCLP